jgi:hypothetical protein
VTDFCEAAEIVRRDCRAPTNDERRAQWAYRWHLLPSDIRNASWPRFPHPEPAGSQRRPDDGVTP